MKEQNLTKWAGQQYRLKVSKLINSVTIAQTVADQTLQFADKCMTAQEREDSDACRAMENLSCVCEETLRVLCEELNRGTRLYEVLEEDKTNHDIVFGLSATTHEIVSGDLQDSQRRPKSPQNPFNYLNND